MVKIDFVNAQEPAINDTNLNQMQLNIENAINAQVSGDTLPVACIVPFTSDTVPENWLLCDGSAVSRTDYALLFSIIGTTYGVGDGSTTFNLPDLKGRVAVGKDSTQTEFDNLGETGGEKTHTLTIEEMPSHNHKQSTNYGGMTNMLEIDSNYGFAQNGAYKDRTVAATSATTNVYGTSSTGGGQAHNILQPYQVTNYIIKARQSAGLVATVVDGLNSTSTTDALSANQGRVLNEKLNYSTTETRVGTWIDGKPLYRKVFYIASLPNASEQEISIASLNPSLITNAYGMASNGLVFNGIRIDAQTLQITLSTDLDSKVIRIATGNDRSSLSGYVVLEYTKTTD